MIYFFAVFMMACGYYTLTYGISLWKEDKNKLGGFGAITIAVLGTTAPLIVLLFKQ